MDKTNYARTLYYISKNRSNRLPLTHALEHDFGLPIPHVEVNDLLLTHSQNPHKILLIDHSESQVILSEIKALSLPDNRLEIVLINVEYRLPTLELLESNYLKGLFYQDEQTDKIAIGLHSILKGQNHLPQEVINQLLYYYRSHYKTNSDISSIELTPREVEVLKHLKSGSSNIQLADDLYISEFTVKSHLYHIFKKLAVKNRMQAIVWANQNLTI